MKHIITMLAILAFAAFNATAQTFSYSNTSCTGVYIVLYADDNGTCGPITAQSDPFIVPAGTSGSLTFTGTTPPAGSGFTWMGGTLPASSNFTFVYAEVYNPCVPVTFPTSITCGGLYGNGVTINNPACGTPTSDSFMIIFGDICDYTLDHCAPCPSPFANTASFTQPTPADWDISIF